jgi:hypothetical protein
MAFDWKYKPGCYGSRQKLPKISMLQQFVFSATLHTVHIFHLGSAAIITIKENQGKQESEELDNVDILFVMAALEAFED